MKKRVLFAFCFLCFGLSIAAQVSRSIHLPVDGTLSKYLTDAAIVEKLKISGNINACDIKFIRDEMPVLTELDLQNATILAYTGTNGTGQSGTSYSYPDNELPQYSFYSNNNYSYVSPLKSVILPDNLISIGEYAFQNCRYLENISLPENLKTIKQYAFAHCENLKSVYLPDKLTVIEQYLFSDCKKLTTVHLPEELVEIKSSAFSNCTALFNITFPDKLTGIGNSAFAHCENLTNITLQEGVKFLEGYVFSNCSNLKSVTLPSGLASMEDGVFAVCQNLTSIQNLNPYPVSIKPYMFYNVNTATCSLTVPASAVERYRQSDVWREFNTITSGGISLNVTPNSVLLGNISGLENRFYEQGEVVSLLAVPLEGLSFENWTTATGEVVSTNANFSLTLTQDTVLIANFKKELNIHLAIAGTLKNKISNPSIVSKLIVTGNIDARDIKFMRDEMPLLTELDLQNATISAYTGTDGTQPYNISYPANVLPAISFYNYMANNNNFSLMSVILPQNLTSIGYSAFLYCTNLKFVGMPSSLQTIEHSIFYNCRNLKSIVLPNQLASISGDAFTYCYGLTSVTNLSVTPQKVESYLFSYVDKNRCTLTVPSSALSKYQQADVWKDFLTITGGGYLINVQTNNSSYGTVKGIENRLYAEDELIQLTAVPQQDFRFIGWINGNKDTVSTNVNYSFVVTQDITLTAVFHRVAAIHLTTAGTFKDIISYENSLTVTKLSVSGKIDARDIKFMRDNMPMLAELDLSKAEVVYYEGYEGTVPNNVYSYYYENQMPTYSFINKASLVSIVLPCGLSIINQNAFENCSKLSTVEFPIGLQGIRNYAFYNCASLISAELPNSLTTINSYAFSGCSNLLTLVLLEQLYSIGYGAFENCSKLTSIINYKLIPINISYSVFQNVNKETCTLTVPSSSIDLYQQAPYWSDFFNIQGCGYKINAYTNKPLMGNVEGFSNNLFYPAGSEVTLTAIAAEGLEFINWTTLQGVIVSSDAEYSFIISEDMELIANFEKELSVNLSQAGTLKDQTYAAIATKLTVTGNIDARDIKFMRDEMPFLKELDLSGATIVEYTGKEGTGDILNITYPANEFPQKAFRNNTSLLSVVLPVGLNSIGNMAFFYCQGLTTITLPESITYIGYSAFMWCNQLEIINLNPIPISISSSVFFGISQGSCTLKVPSTSLGLYRKADVWKDFLVTSGYTLNIVANDDALASISGAGIYDPNTTVKLSTASNESYTFINWTSGADNTVISSDNSFDFEIIQDTVITANFVGKRAELKTLSVSRGILTPAFNSNDTVYALTVGNTINDININAAALQSNATITGTGNIVLEKGENTVEIKVSSEDGLAFKTYTVLVKRLDANADLNSLSISRGILTPEFHTDSINYTVELENSIGSMILTANAADSNAAVQGTGLKLIPVGTNTFDIIVTAEDGIMKKTYSITVIRASKEEEPDAIKETAIPGSNVYPNPSNGIVYIKQKNNEIPFVKVYDANGNLLLEVQARQVDLSPFVSGMYLLQLDNEIIKIIKH